MAKTEEEVPVPNGQAMFGEAGELVINLLQASSNQLNHTNGLLIDNLTKENEYLRAQVKAIRESVEYLYDGAWMPNPDVVRRALWPSDELIKSFQEKDQ